MEPTRRRFKDFLSTAFEKGDYSTDDIIAFVLPLFKKISGLHEAGLVSPFGNDDALYVMGNIAGIDETLAYAPSVIMPRPENTPSSYLPGYRSFEQVEGVHDPQTDIFCLGLVLSSMALGLNLYEGEDLDRFVLIREHPQQEHPRLHPTLGRLITEMTELDRSRRSQDLYDVIIRLEHYRDYDPEKQVDLSKVAGWVHTELKEKSDFILNKLRNRLFDISRRNRLLYFKPNMRFVNLTVGSVPVVLHDESIRPELLFTWTPELSEKIIGGKDIILNKYLRFEDHAYLPASLDRARVESQRDIQEYGFSQLKLVIAFLSWHNLKDEAAERIRSPLLLLPVTLKKNKKVKEDHYVLKALDNAAEVNPVLAGQLRELYGIRLPDLIDLEEMSPEQFYVLLKAQIEDVRNGIVLRYIGKPRIPLLHDEARQMAGTHNAAKTPELYRPLGLALFRQHLEPRPAFLDSLLAAGQQPSAAADDKPVEKQAHEIVENSNNPYNWDFDVCNMVVGNFNYKKMSLVRDYNVVIDRQLRHHTFDALFGDQPRSFDEDGVDGSRPEDWFHVVTADPTQTSAILKSRAGHSYIIQGPPGTGKSQTITNLIADFVARGKNILFVCEKRAALDVVYHRLKQVGLEELCCYIHDSQGDKREFIKNLKATYEDFVENKMDLAALKERRESLLRDMNRHLELLREFHDTCLSEETSTGLTVRDLIELIIALREELVALSAAQEELLPVLGEWRAARPVVLDLETMLEETGTGTPFSGHPFSVVHEAIFLSASPYRILEESLREALKTLDEVEAQLRRCGLDPFYLQEPERLKNLVQFAVLLYPLTRAGNLSLADPARPEAKELEDRYRLYRQQKEVYQQAIQRNSHWAKKLEPGDLAAALSLAAKYEHAFWGSLNSGWRKLKRRLEESYDLSAHSVKPSYYRLLEELKGEYDAAAQVELTRGQLEVQYRFGEHIDTAILGIGLLQSKKGHSDLEHLLQHPDAPALVAALQTLPLNRLEALVKRCLQEFPAGGFIAVRDVLLNVQLNIDALPDWLPALRAFAGLPEKVKTTLRHLPLWINQVEAAIARKALQELYSAQRSFAAIDGQALEKAVLRLEEGYPALRELNAELIRAFVRQRFLHQLDMSGRAASVLNEEQKKFKKAYTEGRKILENEFGKSMRYKSIRELSEKESGLVLKAIKPVWLMSPYSVSDSLPLDDEHFDVVIFDEASQITLEEGVPALYRSRQTIIVGDEKQMPPTDFFSSGGKDKDPDDLDRSLVPEDDEWLSDDADSLLAQGARKLESALLSWHYRSHFETLISFSNHAFYAGELLTIPDKTIHHRQKEPIIIAGPEEAPARTDSLFDRSISFHLLTNSVYEKRSNPAEAAYIARIVRELLSRRVPESIGIVAFSQEQQHAIERALDGLAAEDAAFSQQLEEAYNRTDNDMFTGLIIKNLENIQGDERDIIIISVCYGPDSRGRMLMNFGPVNKKGGEKRLNVLFSRARKHMSVVSSIRHEQITNEYNEGASYFRRFLQYAEFVSSGQMGAARTVLDGLIAHKPSEGSVVSPTIIREQLKEQLVRLGYEVAGPIGQSDFKCSLAVKKNPADDDYALAILIDDESHYRNDNLIEQYYQRPAILFSFGWKVVSVYAKDWLHQPQKVLEQVLKALGDSGIAGKNTDVGGTGSARAGAYDHLAFRRLIKAGNYWEGAADGPRLIVRWGKTGTRGQIRLASYSDEAAALGELDKLENEQREKGYDQDPQLRD
jgi:predicted DNA-binding WGR domain protein/DNA polymerase III delta prime subunit